MVRGIRAPTRAGRDGRTARGDFDDQLGALVAGAGLDRLLSLVDQTLVALLLWSAVFVILRDLFSSHAAGAEKVLGAICGYIIAGDAWGASMQSRTFWCLHVPSGAFGL